MKVLAQKKQIKTWMDCNSCVHFYIDQGHQGCKHFRTVGLPVKLGNGNTKKCCVSYISRLNRIKKPDVDAMEYGVLYCYNPLNPGLLLKDMDF